MLTPQELNDQSFAKAVFGGYDMAAVDSFLEVVSKDYSDLYKENAVLKNKLKVLVEKVEEYRSTEDAMRMALLNAQKMAKDITEEAELKSKALMDDAERSAQNKLKDCRGAIEAEEKRLALAKAKTAEFIAASGELVSKHSEFLSKLSEYAIPPEEAKSAPQEAQPAEAEEKQADNIEKTVAQIIERSMSEQAAEPAEEPDSEASGGGDDTRVFTPAPKDAEEGRKSKFEFVNLQFGSDYDATK